MSSLSIPPEELQERRREPSFEQVFRLLAKIRPPEGNPPNTHPKAEFIDSNTAAAWLGLPLRSFHQYVQTGLLPCYKIGRHKLFRRSELLDALGATRMATRDEILR